jgi:hypothetical protein
MSLELSPRHPMLLSAAEGRSLAKAQPNAQAILCSSTYSNLNYLVIKQRQQKHLTWSIK